MRDSSFPKPIEILIRDYVDTAELAFTPVPVRARADGWTPERQRGFIHRLALCGCIATAARGVGMTKRSAYRLREHAAAEGFAAAWNKALGWGESHTSDQAIGLALEGEIIPIFYRGRRVGEKKRYNESLLLAVLNSSEHRVARKPPPADAALELHRAIEQVRAEGDIASTENKRFPL